MFTFRWWYPRSLKWNTKETTRERKRIARSVLLKKFHTWFHGSITTTETRVLVRWAKVSFLLAARVLGKSALSFIRFENDRKSRHCYNLFPRACIAAFILRSASDFYIRHSRGNIRRYGSQSAQQYECVSGQKFSLFVSCSDDSSLLFLWGEPTYMHRKMWR